MKSIAPVNTFLIASPILLAKEEIVETILLNRSFTLSGIDLTKLPIFVKNVFILAGIDLTKFTMALTPP